MNRRNALPADISPPQVPGTPEPGTSEPGTSEPGGRLPGLPRLFFAEPPDVQRQADVSPGQAGSQHPAGQGAHSAFGAPPLRSPDGPRPGRRRARHLPSRPPDRELRHRALASLAFGVLSLVAMFGLGSDLHRGVYLLIFSAVVGLAACVIGITALVKARRTASYRPRGAIGGIVLGTIACVLSVPLLVTYLAFPTQLNNYLDCVGQAQTSGQLQTCLNRFNKSVSPGIPAAGLRAGPTGRGGDATRSAGPARPTTRPGR